MKKKILIVVAIAMMTLSSFGGVALAKGPVINEHNQDLFEIENTCFRVIPAGKHICP